MTDVLAVLEDRAQALRDHAESFDVMLGSPYHQTILEKIVELEQARASVAELIEACKERGIANAEWASSFERTRQEPGPYYQRAQVADDRYAAALANVQPASTQGES